MVQVPTTVPPPTGAVTIAVVPPQLLNDSSVEPVLDVGLLDVAHT
jgi:hypothetical protein